MTGPQRAPILMRPLTGAGKTLVDRLLANGMIVFPRRRARGRALGYWGIILASLVLWAIFAIPIVLLLSCAGTA
jgi:hypothetical protein